MFACTPCTRLQQWNNCQQAWPRGGDTLRLRGPLSRARCQLCGRQTNCYRVTPEFLAAFPIINPELHRNRQEDAVAVPPRRPDGGWCAPSELLDESFHALDVSSDTRWQTAARLWRARMREELTYIEWPTADVLRLDEVVDESD